MMRTRLGTKAMLNQVLSSPQIIRSPHRNRPPCQTSRASRKKKATNFEYSINAKAHTIMFIAQGEQVPGGDLADGRVKRLPA